MGIGQRLGWPRILGRRVPHWLGIAAAALAFRVGSAILAFVTNVVLPDYQREQFTVTGRTDPFWDAFARYDSGWYFQVARFGYHYTPDGRDTIAFFPVYPMLMRYVGRAFGRAPSDLYLGGIVVSWAAFALAMIGLYRLARLDLSAQRSARAVLLTAVFPFAYFFGAVYSEATFLAAVVWTFYFFRTRRWLVGGVCGAVATATRVNGILIWPALAWMAWRATREAADTADASRGRDRLASVAGLLLVTAGIGLYSLYVYRLSGHPFEWAWTVERWGYYPGGAPWLALVRVARALVERPYEYLSAEPMAPYDTLNGIAGMAFVLSVPFVWYRLGTAYGLYMAANLWLPLSSGQVEGVGRYCSVLFPFFLLIGSVRSRMFFAGTVVVFAMLYTLCLTLFTNIHPLF